MGMYSSFDLEDEINFHMDLLKEFAEKKSQCKCSDDKCTHSIWHAVNEFLKDNDYFSFSIFDDWKIQGYWYEDFKTFLKELEVFMNCTETPDFKGYAKFIYEGGEPFMFILDYQKREIFVEYVPIDNWETMKFIELENKSEFKEIEEKIKIKETCEKL